MSCAFSRGLLCQVLLPPRRRPLLVSWLEAAQDRGLDKLDDGEMAMKLTFLGFASAGVTISSSVNNASSFSSSLFSSQSW